ncbi:MAG: VanZ family protein [Bacteroidales bacterium]|nr:VanZ family protein [Bacteroidales bacterium]
MFEKSLLPGIIWTALIVLLTLIPGNYIPKVSGFLDWIGPDKLVHIFLFGVYAWLLIEGFRKQETAFLRKNAVLISLLLGMVFAFLTEVAQRFVIEGRNGNPYDFLADMLGWLTGYASWRIARRNGKKKLFTSKKYN